MSNYLDRRQLVAGIGLAGAMLTSTTAQALTISIGSGSDGLLSSKTFKSMISMLKELKFSEEDEIKLGDELFPRLVTGSGGLYRNSAIQHAVVEIAKPVIASTERPDLPWQIVVVADNSVNAWALPGGKIAVNVGLLRYVKNEDELAAVIAHEMGHIERKHAVEQIKKKSFVKGLSGIGQSALNSELSNHGAAGYAAGSVVGELEAPMLKLVSSGYARAAEYEADENISRTFKLTGRSVERGVGIFNTLLELLPPGTTEKTSLYSTHPETKARIERLLENTIEEPDTPTADTPSADTSAAFAAIKTAFPTRSFYLKNNR